LKVLLSGPQGSGKSTQAVLLAQDLEVPYIQLGEILRTIALVEDSQIAKTIREAISQGKLAPSDTVAKFVNKRLSQADCRRGFVLDGFPRSAKDIENLNQKLDKVIYLKISEDEGIKRLLARGRADDRQDLIKERLKNYHSETQPILDYFAKLGILIEVDGEKTVAQIHQDIVQKLAINDIH